MVIPDGRFKNDGQLAGYIRSSFNHLTNASMKLFDITPASLSPDLREHMHFLLEVLPADLQGAMRPGCVLLSVDFWYRTARDHQTALAAMEDFATVTSEANGGVFWAQADTDVYLPTAEHQVKQ
jgi:hypothetical protein